MGKRQLNSNKAIKRFGLRVRELRYAKNWTLEDCEAQGYPSWRHLGLVEAGKKNVSFETIINLSNLFGVHPSALFETV